MAALLVLAMNVACGTLPDRKTADGDIRAAVVRAVSEAERERLRKTLGLSAEVATLDAWIEVSVGRSDFEVNGVRFYHARNDQVDPPVNYVVARTVTGELFKLGGFDDREGEFKRLIRELMANHAVPDPPDAAGLTDAYFEFVLFWTPGIPEKRDATPLLRRQSESCVGFRDKYASVEKEENAYRVTAILSDAPSGGVECVEVLLSRAHGFEVVGRTVLVAHSRTDF